MQGKKPGNDKNAMIKALQDRNRELVARNQELRDALSGSNLDREELRGKLKKSEEALASAEGKLRDFEKQGLRVQVRKVSEEKPVRVHVKTVPKHETPADEPQDRRPFGIRVQSVVAEFLKDWGRAPRDPQRIAWDRAYHINGALLNGEARYTLDEILAAVRWLEYALGEERHSVEETRTYLEGKLEELGRKAECELKLLNLAFPPEQQKTNDREAEAVSA